MVSKKWSNMTTKQRDDLLTLTLREMRWEKNDSKRYDLQVIGEGLVSEHKSLNHDEMKKKIEEISNNPKP